MGDSSESASGGFDDVASAYDDQGFERQSNVNPVGSFLGSTTPAEHSENDKRVSAALSAMPDPDTGERMFDNVITGQRESVETYSRPEFAPREGSALDFNQEPSMTVTPLGVVGRVLGSLAAGGPLGLAASTLLGAAGNKMSEEAGHGSITIRASDGVTVNRGDSGTGNRNVYTTENTKDVPEGLMAGKDPAFPGRYDNPPDGDIDYGNDSPLPSSVPKAPKQKASLLSPQQPNIQEEEVDPLAQSRRRYAGQNSLMSSGYRGFA